MLEQEGLAVTIPRRGAEVARMTEKDMEDVLQIRAALDELAVQLATEQITDEQFGALEQARQNFENSLKSDDVKEIAQADVAFHDAIYNATGNAKLVSMLNNLREQMYRYRVEYLKDETIYPRLLKEHKDIAEESSQEGQVPCFRNHAGACEESGRSSQRYDPSAGTRPIA